MIAVVSMVRWYGSIVWWHKYHYKKKGKDSFKKEEKNKKVKISQSLNLKGEVCWIMVPTKLFFIFYDQNLISHYHLLYSPLLVNIGPIPCIYFSMTRLSFGLHSGD